MKLRHPILDRILLLLNPDTEITCGLSVSGGKARYVFSCYYRNDYHVIKQGIISERFSLLFLMPPCVNTSLNNEKLYFISQGIQGMTPEKWIDDNEESMIPAGIEPSETETEWFASDNTVYAGVIKKSILRSFLNSKICRCLFVRSVSIPLWELCILYSKYIQERFAVLKIMEQGSVIGVTEKSYMTKLFNFYGDISDFTDDKSQGKVLEDLKRLLTFPEDTPVIVYSENSGVYESLKDYGSINFNPPPDIKGIKNPAFHEAYACSMHEFSHPDYADSKARIDSEKISSSRRSFLKRCRLLVFGTLAGIVLLLSVKAGLGIYNSKFQKEIAPVKEMISDLKKAGDRLDSLKSLYIKNWEYAGRESVVTLLLSDLQDMFPEGVYAESISITESQYDQWEVTVIAVASSSAMIPEAVNRLSDIEGVFDAGMVYSEKIKIDGPENNSGIRFKLKSSWGTERNTK